MPISADPNDCVSFTLTIDKDKPGVKPFKLRFLTVRQRLAVDRLVLEAGKENDDAKCNDLLSEVLRVGVANLADFGDIDDLLTVNEKWELVFAVQSRTAMEELDRKKSISARTSDVQETGASETTSNPS